MVTRVILVRHGQSTFNAEKRYQGCSDLSVLTEQGFEMAKQTGKFLGQIAIDKTYTSPLKRTQQTAYTILDQHNSPLECHDGLKEIAMPEWQGLTFKHVRSQFPERYQCWKERPHEFQMQVTCSNDSSSVLTQTVTRSSPVLDLYAQAQQFWKEVLPRHEDETILIVSHGGTIRALIGTAIGMECPSFHTLQQSNCGVSILRFSQGLRRPAQLEAMNLTYHLGEVLPKLKEGKLGLRLVLVAAEDGEYAEQLVEVLEPMQFDFCLSYNRANTLARILLNQFSKPPVHLKTERESIFETWHQALKSASIRSNTLNTGLVVTTAEKIRQSISQILDTKSALLSLQPGTISILHYPVDHRPVLQALNFSGEKV